MTIHTAALTDALAGPARASLVVLGAAGQGVHWTALALMHSLRNQGLCITALLPLAADAQWHNGAWHSEQVAHLRACSSYAFPAALMCAAPAPDPSKLAPRPLALRDLQDSYQVLASWTDAVVVDGVGDPEAQLAPGLALGDLAKHLQLPVVLVCEDHEQALRASCALVARCRAKGIWVAGWVRLGCRPLRCVAGIPLLGVIPTQDLRDPVLAARHLDGDRLLAALLPPAAS